MGERARGRHANPTEARRAYASAIVGRDTELDRLDALLDAIAASDGGALVLTGEGGIGKTTLLDYAAATAGARSMVVGTARGVDGEQDLAFAALADIVGPFLDELDGLPEPQRRALTSALALGPGAAPDPFATCAATVALVGAAARRAPVVLVVDDAHLLDRPSAQVLAFVARRVAHDRVGVVIARRGDEPSAFDTTGLDEVALGGLDPAEAAVLVARTGGAAAVPAVLDRLVAATGGNPLALQEIAGGLDREELAGQRPLTEPLSVGPAVRRAVARRVGALGADARRAVLVVAADPSVPARTALLAGDALGIERDAFASAEASGVLVFEGEHFRFTHPLVCAAVYGDAAAEARRAVHAALAGALSGESDAARRAWHLARAAFGPDETAAAALDAAGAQASGRGAHASAAHALARAAELSLDSAAAYTRWAGAGQAAILAGDLTWAVSLCDRAVDTAGDPLSRAFALLLRAAPRYWTWPAQRQHDALVAEAEEVGAVDPGLAGMLIVLSGACAVTQGDMAAAAAAVTALTGRWGAQGLVLLAARALDGTVAVLTGRRREGVPTLLDALGQLQPGSDPLTQWIRLVTAQGLSWGEAHTDAAAALDPWLRDLRTEGRVGELPYALAMRADIDHRRDAWDPAWAAATEALELAEQTGDAASGLGLAYCLMMVAALEAHRGEAPSCREHVARAMRIADERELRPFRGYGNAILGTLELGSGAPSIAAHHLALVAEAAALHGDGDPNQLRWRADYAEALALTDRPHDARREVDQLHREADATGSTWAAVAAARLRGTLAGPAEQVGLLRDAADRASATPYVFEQGRTLLALGQALRRARRPGDARGPLDAALARFQSLGADPWAGRASAELRAVGAPTHPEDRGAVHSLTSQELRIALAVADGATNREVAAHLFLSPRTVEFHLGRAYRKLGVRTRTGLAHRLRADDGWDSEK